MRVLFIIFMVIFCHYSVAKAESRFDSMKSSLESWEVQDIPQSAQDIMGLTEKMAKWQDCIRQDGICIQERCDWQFCMDTIEGPPSGYECNSHMSALKQCMQQYVNQQQENKCALLLNKFNNAFRKREMSLCSQILLSSTKCDWHERASDAFYNETKRPDFPSVPQPRPTYPHTNKKCPEQNPGNKYTYRFDTNGIPDDDTYVYCQYFKDGHIKYESFMVDGKKEGVTTEYWTFSGQPKHPVSRTTTYRKGVKHGKATLHSWCQGDNYKAAYKAEDIYYENGKQNKKMTVRHEIPCRGK